MGVAALAPVTAPAAVTALDVVSALAAVTALAVATAPADVTSQAAGIAPTEVSAPAAEDEELSASDRGDEESSHPGSQGVRFYSLRNKSFI